MWWSSGPERPSWSLEDLKAVLPQLVPRLEKNLGEEVYLTSSGLLTETQLKQKLKTLLGDLEKPTTCDLLAVEIGVEKEPVQTCLNKLMPELTDVFVGQLVLPRPVVEQLLKDLAVASAHYAASSKFCHDHRIGFNQLKWLTGRQDDISVIGDTICSLAQFQKEKRRVAKILNSAETPVALTSLDVPSPIRLALFKQLASTLDGTFDQTCETYTPRKFVSKNREECAHILQSKGFIHEDELQRFGIRDTAKFARRENAKFSKNYLVTEMYISFQTDAIKKELDKNGFISADDLEPREPLLALLPDLSIVNVSKGSSYLIKRNFESTLREQLSTVYAQQGAEAAETMLGARKLESDASPSTLVNSLDLPRSIDIQGILSNDGVPDDLAESLAPRFDTIARQQFRRAALEKIEEALEAQRNAVDLKIAVYLNGLLSSPENLMPSLFEEWRHYVSGAGALVAGSTTQAKEQYSNKFSKEELTKVASGLVALTRKKLSKTTDPAMVLHLAIVTWHAEHFTDGTGVLKVGGKLVPKLLKAFTFPDCYTELKNDVKKGMKASENVEGVKATILG